MTEGGTEAAATEEDEDEFGRSLHFHRIDVSMCVSMDIRGSLPRIPPYQTLQCHMRRSHAPQDWQEV